MNIKFNKKTKEFHLYNGKISYILYVLESGHLGHLYYGKKIRDRESFQHLLQIGQQGVVYIPAYIPEKNGFALDYVKQEFPFYGIGDYREPAISILQENGSRIVDFKYKSHRIYKGKEQIKGLPSVYAENENEAITLEVTLIDEVIKTEIILKYTIYEEYSAVIRSSEIVNKGEETINLERALSASIDFNSEEYKAIHLTGAWARERHVEEVNLTQSKFVIDSKTGMSGSHNNPFLALKKKDTTEKSGEVFGFSLIYSGNHITQVEKNKMGTTRVNMGINPFNFNWILNSNESFQTPEVVIAYSNKGLNKMSQTFHNLYRDKLIRSQWRDKVRPIVVNNWETTHMEFNEEQILDIARGASKLGIEMFVLDDGWFGKRDNDKAGLGDWVVNREKLPSGIDGLSQKIKDMGLDFGLWLEPEMVNPDSDLFRVHPEWILTVPGREDILSRNQCTLNLGRPEVVDYLFDSIVKLLEGANIKYIKWDMNRSMTNIYSTSLESKQQGEVVHRYFLGLYELLERLVTRFPEILWESCAGGGHRFDAGMLHYMPQTWASDDSDAIERLKIQYGTSMVYPLNSIGAHVSAIPNHQTGRKTSIQTRANVAYFGTFGYELDFNIISEEEKEIVKKQIKFIKKYRDVIQFGDFYRLHSPFEDQSNKTAWMSVSKDKSKVIVGNYNLLSVPNSDIDRLKLVGLDEDILYKCSSPIIQGTEFYGDELMSSGLMFKDYFRGKGDPNKIFTQNHLNYLMGDFKSSIIILEKVLVNK